MSTPRTARHTASTRTGCGGWPAGQRVLATNLGPALANNNEWASLGNGTYAPLCLSWLVTAHNIATLYYIKLNLNTHGWSKISSAELSTC